MKNNNLKKEPFYIFEVLFRDGAWKTWGIGTIAGLVGIVGGISLGIGHNQKLLDKTKETSGTNGVYQTNNPHIPNNTNYTNTPRNRAY